MICFCWVAYIYCLRDNLHEILENFILERVDDEKGLRYLIKVHLLLSKIGKRIEEFISLGLFESAHAVTLDSSDLFSRIYYTAVVQCFQSSRL